METENQKETKTRPSDRPSDRLGMETDNQKETKTETDRKRDRLWETGRQTQTVNPKAP